MPESELTPQEASSFQHTLVSDVLPPLIAGFREKILLHHFQDNQAFQLAIFDLVMQAQLTMLNHEFGLLLNSGLWSRLQEISAAINAVEIYCESRKMVAYQRPVNQAWSFEKAVLFRCAIASELEKAMPDGLAVTFMVFAVYEISHSAITPTDRAKVQAVYLNDSPLPPRGSVLFVGYKTFVDLRNNRPAFYRFFENPLQSISACRILGRIGPA